jgi:hypothetical protein
MPDFEHMNEEEHLSYYKWYGKHNRLINDTAYGLYDLWTDDGDHGYDPDELWKKAIHLAEETVSNSTMFGF